MSTVTLQTRWFEFDQNNSGGYFSPPAESVIVEATDVAHAYARFMDTDPDMNYCSCCGSRWSSEWAYNSWDECPSDEDVKGNFSMFRQSTLILPMQGEPRMVGEYKRHR